MLLTGESGLFPLNLLLFAPICSLEHQLRRFLLEFIMLLAAV